MASTTAPDDPAQLCALCIKAAPKQCSGCHNIRYCSTACQKADWALHKIACKSFRKALQPPSPHHIRAIYFPEKGSLPYFVWVYIKNKVVNGELKIDISNLDIPEERKHNFREQLVFEHNESLDRAIPSLTWNASFFPNGKLAHPHCWNSSVAAIEQGLPCVIFGPVVFHAPNRNLDTVDFSNIIDKFRWVHYRSTHCIDRTARYALGAVPSVMVNCLGDKFVCGQPSFVEAQVSALTLTPGYHKSFDLLIGNLIGIPLVGIQVPQGLPWTGRAVLGPDGTTLPGEFNFQLPALDPLIDPTKLGSVKIARRDKKDILSAHVDALCQYSESLTIVTDQVTPSMAAAKLRADVTAEGFKAFWEKLKSEGKFPGIRSPYEV